MGWIYNKPPVMLEVLFFTMQILILLFWLQSHTLTPKMIVYYDTSYKLSWFQRINMDIEFRKFKHKSEEAREIMKPGYYNYYMYIISSRLNHSTSERPHWSVKGLSYLGKKTSVMTIKNMNDLDIQKVLEHEFAHGMGLPHCEDKDCIQNDAKGKYSNLKNCNDFKGSCKAFMKNYIKF